MNADQQVKTAVANIQDELSRILAVANLYNLRPNEDKSSGISRLTSEYNGKLREFKTQNLVLSQENKKLRARIKSLQKQLSSRELTPQCFERPAAGSVLAMAPPKKRRLSSQEQKTDILSSPVKVDSPPKLPDDSRCDVHGEAHVGAEPTSSQFNRMATQYSDACSQSTLEPLVARTESRTGDGAVHETRFLSPLDMNSREAISHNKKRSGSKETQLSLQRATAASDKFSVDDDPDDVVADSQDEYESFGGVVSSPKDPGSADSTQKSQTKQTYPSHYTALQRVEFLRTYHKIKLEDKKFLVDFSKNPITEKAWALDDFIPNTDWKPRKKLNSHIGAMTVGQEKLYEDFFKEAGFGQKPPGPNWSSGEEPDDLEQEHDWVRSQVMDKYSSPPGFMTGDFVSTQEAQDRRKRVIKRQQDRIRRRIQSALAGGEFVFYEEVFNEFAKSKRYVNNEPVFQQ